MRTPAQRLQRAHGPFLRNHRGTARQRPLERSQHGGFGARNWRMAVGQRAGVGPVGFLPVRNAFRVDVHAALGGMVVMFGRANRRRDVIHAVRDRGGRGCAERDGRDQQEEDDK